MTFFFSWRDSHFHRILYLFSLIVHSQMELISLKHDQEMELLALEQKMLAREKEVVAAETQQVREELAFAETRYKVEQAAVSV